MIVRWISALACIAALAACSKAGPAPSAHGNSLVVAYSQEPVSLNPLYLEGAVSYAVSEIGFSYLTNYDSHGNIVADLAGVRGTAHRHALLEPHLLRATWRLRIARS